MTAKRFRDPSRTRPYFNHSTKHDFKLLSANSGNNTFICVNCGTTYIESEYDTYEEVRQVAALLEDCKP